MSADSTVMIERKAPILIVTINRPDCRNAVDGLTAQALAQAFREFDADPELSVAILTGAGGHFCAGADLKAVASGDINRMNRLSADGDAPMGISRMQLKKPVIAAINGYCVAGGLELALWCDLRVADDTAVLGVFCRRFGVPLIDGGTVRLPRAIGMSRALDLILTGRPVAVEEALNIGLVNRRAPTGQALAEAEQLALQLAGLPQACLRNDRLSAYQQWGMSESEALANEFQHGLNTLYSGESVAGANRFQQGEGKHGKF